MKAVPKVDHQGYYYEDVLIDESFSGVMNHASTNVNPAVTGYIVGYPVPEGLYKPRLDVERLVREYKSDDAQKWPDGSDKTLAMSYWIEGLTQDEVAEINKPAPLSELEQFKQQTAEQQAAMWDFILSGGA